MTVNEFERLIDKITASTGLSSEEIAVQMGYNKGYNSQIKSRNYIPDKYVTALKNKYFKGEAPEYTALEEQAERFGNINTYLRIIESQQRMLESQQETILLLTRKSMGESHRKKAS